MRKFRVYFANDWGETSKEFVIIKAIDEEDSMEIAAAEFPNRRIASATRHLDQGY